MIGIILVKCVVTKFLEKTYFSSNLPYSKVIRLTIVRNIMVTKRILQLYIGNYYKTRFRNLNAFLNSKFHVT